MDGAPLRWLKGSSEAELPQVPLIHLATRARTTPYEQMEFDALHLINVNDNNLQMGPFFILDLCLISWVQLGFPSARSRTGAATLSLIMMQRC